ncbi:hypothetical protein Tco_0857632 [Tanacetum coccineum]|uniref:Uncharacterized protein n=1 Tax=Tanacetum coccineum TaxID=301880 RepID=A0ABQ5B6S1_9ASTR
MIANESLRMRETSSTTTITTVTMITIDNRIKDKKPSELILPPLDMLETFPYVRHVDYITRDLAVSSVSLTLHRLGLLGVLVVGGWLSKSLIQHPSSLVLLLMHQHRNGLGERWIATGKCGFRGVRGDGFCQGGCWSGAG